MTTGLASGVGSSEQAGRLAVVPSREPADGSGSPDALSLRIERRDWNGRGRAITKDGTPRPAGLGECRRLVRSRGRQPDRPDTRRLIPWPVCL